MTARSLRRAVVGALALAALSVSCRDGGPFAPELPRGTGQLALLANFNALTATSLVVEVTAPDIATPLVFNFPVVNQQATGAITLPVGANRTITVRAFDGSTETHRGSTTITVVEGTNPSLTIQLLPLAGTVPVTVTFGAAVVAVTPATWTMAVDDSVTFTAAVTNAQGQVQTGAVVRWASTDTRLLTIDSTGRAVARGTGVVQVVAVASGAAGTAAVTIGPRAPGTPPSFLRTWVGGAGAGAQRTDWGNPNNWTPAAVPTETDSVVIGTATFQPAMVVDTFRVRDLVLRPGANISLNFRRLTVVGGVVSGEGGATSNGGTLVATGGARLRGTLTAAVEASGGTTIALADTTRTPLLTVTGTSTVFDVAGQVLVLTAPANQNALIVNSGGVFQMDQPTDSVDAGGLVYFQSTAASHVGAITAGTLVLRSNLQDGTQLSASGTHRTVFAGAARQDVYGMDANTRPANRLQAVEFRGVELGMCSQLRVASFTALTGTLSVPCGGFGLTVDGSFATAAGTTTNLAQVVLFDASGTANVEGAYTAQFTDFRSPAQTVRVGLAYQSLRLYASQTFTDSVRATAELLISGASTVLDLQSANRIRAGSLRLEAGGSFTLDEARDTLDVVGAVNTDPGGDMTGRLTAGVLRIGGQFNGGRYNASGTNTVVLNGTTATRQDVYSFNDAGSPPSALQNLVIENTGAGVGQCSTLRVRGAFTVATPVPVTAPCGGLVMRVDGVITTVAGSSMQPAGVNVANVAGTQNVAGAWAPTTTGFVAANAAVNPALTYQNVTFAASNALPAQPLTITGSLVVTGGGTVLDVNGARLDVGGNLTVQTDAVLAMADGDTVQVAGFVAFNSTVPSTPTGGQLALRGNINGTGLTSGGTFKLLLNGTARQQIAGFDFPRPIPRLHVANPVGMQHCAQVVVTDTFYFAAAGGTPIINDDCGGFTLEVRNAIRSDVGTTLQPHRVDVAGTATLAAVAGTFQPLFTRYSGTGLGALPAAANFAYRNVEFTAPYTLTAPLTASGNVSLTGTTTQLTFGGRRVTADGGFSTAGSATIRMESAADSLVAGTGTGTALSFGGGSTGGLVTAGTILARGTISAGSLVMGGTSSLVVTDDGLPAAPRAYSYNGTGTLQNVTVRGSNQLTLNVNANATINGAFDVQTGPTVSVPFGYVWTINGAVTTAPGSVVDLGTATMVLNGPGGTGGVLGTWQGGITRFAGTTPTVNPALAYGSIDFRTSASFSGATTLTGDLTAQGGGVQVDLGGQRVTVGDGVSFTTNAILVMDAPADTLIVQGASGGNFSLASGTNSVLIGGVLRVRTNQFNGGNFVAQTPHTTVFDGATGGAVQSLVNNSQFGRLSIAGNRGLSTTSYVVTVGDTLAVTQPVPFGGSPGTVDVGGPLSTVASSILTAGTLVMRDTSSLNGVLGTATIATLRYAANPASASNPYDLPTDMARFTVGNLTVDAGATAIVGLPSSPTYTRIGSGTSGILTINGTLLLTDPATLQACGSSNGNVVGSGVFTTTLQGLATLQLRAPGPAIPNLTSFTGTFDRITPNFGVTTGC